MSDEDALALIYAIKQFRVVLSVTGNVSDIGQHISDERAKQVLGQKIFDVLYKSSDCAQ